MAKVTNEEFQKRFKEKYGDEFTLLDEYIDSRTKMRIRHNSEYCGNHIRVMRADAILKKLHCRVCEGLEYNNKTFRRKIKDEIEILEEYKNRDEKILVRCKKCKYEWRVTPISLLMGSSCPCCANNIPYTIKDIEKIIKNKYKGEFTLVSKEILPKRHVIIKHNKCKSVYEVTIATIIKKATCPHCIAKSLSNKYVKSHDVFVDEIDKKYNNQFTILSQYLGVNKKVLIRHNSEKCKNSIFEILPSTILYRGSCPVCANKKIIKGINDIATTHPYFAKYFTNVEDAYSHSYGSNKKVSMKCPDCGYKKKIKISDLTNKSFACPKCSDGISYPEKFMMCVLDQLGVEYETQYSPDWIKPKKYDFYIPGLNCIIETNGRQHYSNATGFETFGGRTVEEEQENDRFKKEIALKNDIKHYIELDCRYSNLRWIKNSITNSELPNLIDLNNINWKECLKNIMSSLAKKACELYNTTNDIEYISFLMKINRNTILKYIKIGTQLGWCNYNIENSNRIKSKKIIEAKRKPVIVLETLQVFSGCNVLSDNSVKIFKKHLSSSCISLVCRNKQKSCQGYHFRYVDDLTRQERIKFKIDEKLKELEENNM